MGLASAPHLTAAHEQWTNTESPCCTAGAFMCRLSAALRIGTPLPRRGSGLRSRRASTDCRTPDGSRRPMSFRALGDVCSIARFPPSSRLLRPEIVQWARCAPAAVTPEITLDEAHGVDLPCGFVRQTPADAQDIPDQPDRLADISSQGDLSISCSHGRLPTAEGLAGPGE